MMNLLKIFFLIIPLLPFSVEAYVGPGTGLSVLGSVIAFVGALLLLILGFIWYPIKRLITAKKQQKQPEQINNNEARNRHNLDD
ncbi:hypothetical protein [Shewanella sp. UCD-KL12]|uniref:hypothetical protein n=1 Tax=Shewanella sp. UCD-KL12 TaxID=1917163 RepID=UPI0009FB11AF|nr:hypothetical protein [Shewanella sp. UCD-KL12]